MQPGEECPNCGRAILRDAPGGLCPVCLILSALEAPRDEDETSELTDTPEPAPGSGLHFGAYTTLRVLGEGGMGIVYLAQQKAPIQRTVALKVIKPGFDSHQVVARFESERQALAMMDHPGIAHVFDAGETPDHRPYFAMEYVSGIPITEYCDARRLNNRQRLELFGEVCQAIHHAHRKGIIHRDLKPSNVLVAEEDGKASPKVIDFGIAKATSFHLTERTLYTEQGLLLGTPEYMSPEQAGPNPHDVDTATDIYSLGVLLYELLVGALPFEARELRAAGYLEMLRVIREEEPPTLARRLEALGPQVTQIAERHHTDAHSLLREVRGDLEWITLRAFEKDRHRRYGSVSELAADIARHLKDEPVLAGPPGRGYRLRKFVRKHRFGVGAAAAILVCLMTGLAVSTVLFLREQRQRDIAERQSYEANLANAGALIEASDVEAARERLFQCPPRLRGWEWRLLYAQSDNSVATLRGTGDLGQPGLAFSPGGGRLYLRMHRTVHAWEIPSWRPAGDFGPFGPVIGMSRDGSRIVVGAPATSGLDPVVIEVASGRQVAVLRGDSAAVAAVFNSQADRVATGGIFGTFRLWDLRSGRLLASFGPAESAFPFPQIAFSPDGRLVATSSSDILRLFDSGTGKLLRTANSEGVIFALAFSPDSKHFATANNLSSLHLWNVASGKAERSWKVRGQVLAAGYSPDGSVLVTSTDGGAVTLWDAGSGSAITNLTGPGAEPVRAVAFSPEGKWILAASNLGNVWIWDAATYGGKLLSRSVLNFTLCPDRSLIAVVERTGTTFLDAATGSKLRQGLPTGTALAFSPAGDCFAIAFKSGIGIIDVRTGSMVRVLSGYEGSYALSVAFNRDGRLLASGIQDGTARIWDTSTGKCLVMIGVRDPVNVVAFSPNGKLLATGAGGLFGPPAFGGALKLWEVSSGKINRSFAPASVVGEIISAVAFNPTGELLVSADRLNGSLRIVDLSAGRMPAEMLSGQVAVAGALAFSTDGRLLASGGDLAVRLWDPLRHGLLFALREPREVPLRLAFSSDGSRLYASYSDRTLRVWSTETAYPVRIREFIAGLRREQPSMLDVRHEIENSSSLDDSERALALRLCSWRMDLDRVALEQIWGPAVHPPASEAERKLHLRRARDLHSALPWSLVAWTALGAAQYRNGLYREAAATLARASAVAHDDPRIDVFLAMTHNRLGNAAKAQMSMGKAHGLLKNAGSVAQQHSRVLLNEAEALMAEKGQQRQGLKP